MGATEKRRDSAAACKDIGNLNQKGGSAQFIRDEVQVFAAQI
jgi:hypothetical protein